MTIAYREELDAVEPRDLEGFFVGWPSHPDPETHLRILENSDAVAFAIESDSGTVVGFANAISDGVLSAYIPLLEVRPDWQGRGIGSRLVETICDQLDHLYMVDAVCDAELEGFYERLGFRALTGMAKRNYDNQQGASAGEGTDGEG